LDRKTGFENTWESSQKGWGGERGTTMGGGGGGTEKEIRRAPLGKRGGKRVVVDMSCRENRK